MENIFLSLNNICINESDNEKNVSDFKIALERILTSPSGHTTAKLLGDIDAKSTETFNHSINVALHTYNLLSKTQKYSDEEILSWTQAALLHDIGKLATPLIILHSKENLALLSDDEQIDLYKTMMRHSIDSYGQALTLNLPKETIFAAVAHHVNAKAIDNGPEKCFEGATASRKSWEDTYGLGFVESVLIDTGSWLTEKDKYAIETITFMDSTEAQRSTDRKYKAQQDWENVTFRKNGRPQFSIYKTITTDVSNGILYKDALIAQNKSFQQKFDYLQNSNCPQYAREAIREYVKNEDFFLSEDKLEDIKNNPDVGIIFTNTKEIHLSEEDMEKD